MTDKKLPRNFIPHGVHSSIIDFSQWRQTYLYLQFRRKKIPFETWFGRKPLPIYFEVFKLWANTI